MSKASSLAEISEMYCSAIGTAGNKVIMYLPNSLGGKEFSFLKKERKNKTYYGWGRE